MARFDAYPIPGGARQGYVLDVQADLLSDLVTRAVVPLVPAASAPKPIKDLNPVFQVEGEPFVMLTQAIASVPAKELKRVATSLESERDAITRALDRLLVGF